MYSDLLFHGSVFLSSYYISNLPLCPSVSLQVQLQLLTAIVKLFLKKPTETQELVQQVLSLATQVGVPTARPGS